jgi:hypothetical protein
MPETRTHFFVRLPVELKREIQRVARRNGRSTTREVEKVLENHVGKYSERSDGELVGTGQ